MRKTSHAISPLDSQTNFFSDSVKAAYNTRYKYLGPPDGNYAEVPRATVSQYSLAVIMESLSIPDEAVVNSLSFGIYTTAAGYLSIFTSPGFETGSVLYSGYVSGDTFFTLTTTPSKAVPNGPLYMRMGFSGSSTRAVDAFVVWADFDLPTQVKVPVEKTLTQWASQIDSVTDVTGYTTYSGPATNALGPIDGNYFGLNDSIDPTVNLKLSGFDFTRIPDDVTIKKVLLTVYKDGKTSVIRIYRDNTYTYPGGHIGAVGDSTQMGHLVWDITSAIKISDLVTEPLAMDLTIDTNNPKNLGKIDAIKITVDYTEYVTAPTVKRFTGSEWVTATTVKRFDGSQWVNSDIKKL